MHPGDRRRRVPGAQQRRGHDEVAGRAGMHPVRNELPGQRRIDLLDLLQSGDHRTIEVGRGRARFAGEAGHELGVAAQHGVVSLGPARRTRDVVEG